MVPPPSARPSPTSIVAYLIRCHNRESGAWPHWMSFAYFRSSIRSLRIRPDLGPVRIFFPTVIRLVPLLRFHVFRQSGSLPSSSGGSLRERFHRPYASARFLPLVGTLPGLSVFAPAASSASSVPVPYLWKSISAVFRHLTLLTVF